MNDFFRYIGYAVVSIFLGWISAHYPSVNYIGKIEVSIVPILLSLFVLYTTLSSLLIKEILKYKATQKDLVADIAPTINALKRNVVIELIILCITFIALILKGFLLEIFVGYDWIVNTFTNSLIVFSILYFLLVIYDSFAGLFNILIENTK